MKFSDLDQNGQMNAFPDILLHRLKYPKEVREQVDLFFKDRLIYLGLDHLQTHYMIGHSKGSGVFFLGYVDVKQVIMTNQLIPYHLKNKYKTLIDKELMKLDGFMLQVKQKKDHFGSGFLELDWKYKKSKGRKEAVQFKETNQKVFIEFKKLIQECLYYLQLEFFQHLKYYYHLDDFFISYFKVDFYCEEHNFSFNELGELKSVGWKTNEAYEKWKVEFKKKHFPV